MVAELGATEIGQAHVLLKIEPHHGPGRSACEVMEHVLRNAFERGQALGKKWVRSVPECLVERPNHRMKVTPTRIPDVLLIEPKVFGDDRGFFL
mgnify:CR=1 FL=1